MAGDLKDRLARVVHYAAHAYCCSCLSKRLGAPDKDVREAAQVVALRVGFVLRPGVCHGCAAIDVLLRFEPTQGMAQSA